MSFAVGAEAYDRFMGRYSAPLAEVFADFARPPEGGRRKYYRITDAGRAVYRSNVAAWVATRRIIDSLLDVKEKQ